MTDTVPSPHAPAAQIERASRYGLDPDLLARLERRFRPFAKLPTAPRVREVRR